MSDSNTTLTELEIIVLKAIPNDCFFENGRSSRIWTDCFLDDCGVKIEQGRALLTTLQTKGFIEYDGGRQGTIRLTWKGINRLSEIGDDKIKKMMVKESRDDYSISGNKWDN